jgi:hypothetical protein
MDFPIIEICCVKGAIVLEANHKKLFNCNWRETKRGWCIYQGGTRNNFFITTSANKRQDGGKL